MRERENRLRPENRQPQQDEFLIAATPTLSAMPLLQGLRKHPRVDLVLQSADSVCSLLDDGLVDAALVPAFELQRDEKSVTVLGAGCVSCSGTSFAARIYSYAPARGVRAVWADPEARTASALAQVIWAYDFNHTLEVLPLEAGPRRSIGNDEGILVIENEVVSRPPLGFDWQLDLCALWDHMTGLPFVSSVWAASNNADLVGLYQLLENARRSGQKNLRKIATQCAPEINWPEDLAIRFIEKHIDYEFGNAQRDGLEEFFHLCERLGLTHEFRPVQYYRP